MIGTLVTLVVICAIAALAYWAVNTLGTPEPIRRIVIVAIVVIAALIVIGLIAGLFGVNLGLPRT
jgi:heme A synthase